MNADEPHGIDADSTGALGPASRSPNASKVGMKYGAAGAIQREKEGGPGGARPGAGRPRLSPVQRDARKHDREAIERARRPAITALVQQLRAERHALGLQMRSLDNKELPLTERLEIAKNLVDQKAAREILDRTGVQKLKSVELRAFDDLARELELEQQPEKAPEITHEQLERYTMALIAAGYGRTRPIDVPYEEMLRQRDEGESGAH